jgi:endonuclease/exonuclease/phosphatase family metal-dependent hydrolase
MPKAVRLKVMTFNLRFGHADDGENHWGNRYRAVAQAIHAFDPDLLALQECVDFQSLFVGHQLPNHAFHGAGRDNGYFGGEMVPIFYRKPLLDLTFGSHFWLSESPHVPGSKSWGAPLPRMATWGTFKVAGAKHPLTLVNTHLDYESQAARVEGVKLIRRYLSVLNPNAGPTLLTGDLNEDVPGPALTTLTKSADGVRLRDTYRDAHPTITRDESTFHAFEGKGAGGRIDWILASPHFKTISATIDRDRYDDRYPSDHFPLTAVVELNE